MLATGLAIDRCRAYSKSTSTPGATTVDLLEVGQLGKHGLVAERNVDEAVVGKSAHGSNGGGLLATTQGTSGDEQTGILAPVATGGPDAASVVPESLPLCREVTITSRDTEQHSVVFLELFRVGNGVILLVRSVHLIQDLLGQGLSNPIERPLAIGFSKLMLLVNILVDVGLAASRFNTLLFGLSQVGDVAVHGVLPFVSHCVQCKKTNKKVNVTYVNDSNLGSHGDGK